MPLGIVQDRPRLFYPHPPLSPDRRDRRLQILHFEQEHGIVLRRIRFDTLLFEADESSFALEPCVVPLLLFGNLQSQNTGIETSRRFEVVELEFDSDESRSGHSLGSPPAQTATLSTINESVFSTSILSFSTVAVESAPHFVRGRKYLPCCQYSFSDRC